MKRFGDTDTQHEGKGTDQVDGGLADQGARASATVHNSRMNTDGVPETIGDGGMDWSIVNHNGFHEGRIAPQNASKLA